VCPKQKKRNIPRVTFFNNNQRKVHPRENGSTCQNKKIPRATFLVWFPRMNIQRKVHPKKPYEKKHGDEKKD
jgi:hypothetical protein